MRRFFFGLAIASALAIAVACTGSDPDLPVQTQTDASTSPPPAPDPNDDDASFDGAVASNDDLVEGGASAVDASIIPVVEDAGGWSPETLGASAVVWLEGDKGIAHPAGDMSAAISRWTDRRGGDNALYGHQANGYLRPSVSPDKYHDHSAVRFAAACNMLAIDDVSALQFAGGNFTVAVAASFHNATAGFPGNFVSKLKDLAPHEGFLLRVAASDGEAVRGSVSVSLFASIAVTGGVSNRLHPMVYRRTAPRAIDVRSDGQGFAVTMKDPVDVSAVGNDVRIGAQRFSVDKYEPSDCLDGDIAEIVIVNRALLDEEVGLIEAYFKEKYAL